MIITIAFSILLLLSLWPFFIYLGVMNFRKDPNAMETPLPGRPARRTIGRKNEDVSRAIAYIFLGYCLVIGGLYSLLNFKDLLPMAALVVIGCIAFFLAFFLFAPANRLSHAYIDAGHLAVVHLVSTMVAFNIIASIIYSYRATPSYMGFLTMVVVGAMMIFSRPPDIELKKRAAKKKQSEEEEEFS